MLAMRRVLTLALWCCLGAVLWYAYFRQPINSGNMTTYGWLTGHWENVSNYSHGPLIPLIALWLLYLRWRELKQCQFGLVKSGYWVLAAGMLVYYFGVKGGQERFVVLSLIVVLYGLALALAGREPFRIFFFPITFLLLMIPLNFIDELVGFPLRIMVAKTATVLLNWLGIETTRVGSGIYSSVFRFDVADPCSGIRSLMALTTVTAAYAYVIQRSQWKRWVLFLSSMPLAMLGNLARVTSVAVVAQVYGQEVAATIYHDYSGYLLFGVALSAMVGVGWLLNAPYRQLWDRWLKPPPARPSTEWEKLHG
jgi:exosortase